MGYINSCYLSQTWLNLARLSFQANREVKLKFFKRKRELAKMKKTAWGNWPLGRAWGTFKLYGLRGFHGTSCKLKSIRRIFSKLPVRKKQQTVRKAILSGALGRSQITSFEFPRRKVAWICFHSVKEIRRVNMFFVNKEDCTKIDDSFLSLNKNKRAGVEYWPKVVRLYFTSVFPRCLQYSVNFLSTIKTQTNLPFPKAL